MSKQEKKDSNIPTIANAAQFDMLFPILESIFNEIKELSKKKQDGALNEIKVKMVNKILQKVKTILKDDPSLEFLDLLDEVSLPTNSDAVLIITQFMAGMQQYKDKYFKYNRSVGKSIWQTSD